MSIANPFDTPDGACTPDITPAHPFSFGAPTPASAQAASAQAAAAIFAQAAHAEPERVGRGFGPLAVRADRTWIPDFRNLFWQVVQT